MVIYGKEDVTETDIQVTLETSPKCFVSASKEMSVNMLNPHVQFN